jgi:cytochrome d ubiquinol oxidase subunit I
MAILMQRVKGLDVVKKEDQPPVMIPHIAFQVMVGLGMFMMLIAIVYLYGIAQ